MTIVWVKICTQDEYRSNRRLLDCITGKREKRKMVNDKLVFCNRWWGCRVRSRPVPTSPWYQYQ